jgi:hypothetical protein
MERSMRSTKAILLVALLGAYFIGWAAADGNDSGAFTLKPEAWEEMIAFVKEARGLVLKEGKDKALEAFNDLEGKFVRGDLYSCLRLMELVWPIRSSLKRLAKTRST